MKDNNVEIKLVFSKDDEPLAKEIMYGIEEEEVPYNFEYVEKNAINTENIVKIAYEQARKSKLLLGVAICKQKVVSHYSKLEENKPLFELNNLKDAKDMEKRIFGSNIARIVKGIPLKSVEIEEELKSDIEVDMNKIQNIESFETKGDIEMTNSEFEKMCESILEKIQKENKINDINLEIAEKLAEKAIEKATEINSNITVSVVNKGGNLILLKKMDKAIIASIDVSVKKAYTALSLNCPSSKVDLEEFKGLDKVMGDKIVLFGGGYPIVYNGNLIGGIGVSGGSSENDENIAIYAIEKILKN